MNLFSRSTLLLKNHGWPSGTPVVEVITCAKSNVGSDGTLTVPMQAGVPKIYIAQSAVGNSGICK
jgi:alpha-amylase